MNLRLLRIIFIGLSALIPLALVYKTVDEVTYLMVLWSVGGGLLVSLGVVGLEVILSQRMASMLPSIILGIVLGVLTASLVDHFFILFDWYTQSQFSELGPIFLSWLFVYLWVFFIIQTRDTFKISIPYIEFKKQGHGVRPFILDTSALIDGRIVELSQTHLLNMPLVIPQFVLDELQLLANSSDKLKHQKGRRGLDQVKNLQQVREVRVDESFVMSDLKTDQRLMQLSLQSDGILVTTDYNLFQIAQIQDIDALNVNEIAKALHPVFLPGDKIEVNLVKPGESATQGIGYLEDGTMVVVDHGREKIGQQVTATVTSNLQTNAGRMIFARCDRQEND